MADPYSTQPDIHTYLSNSIPVAGPSGGGSGLGDRESTGEHDEDGDGDGGAGGEDGGGDEDGGAPLEKKKSTRGSRACTVCRKLKMRCVGAEEGPPCKRCKTGNHECIFEESMRGRRTNRKTDAMAKSLKKMEATLENVLKSIAQPGGIPMSAPPSGLNLSAVASSSSSIPPPPTGLNLNLGGGGTNFSPGTLNGLPLPHDSPSLNYTPALPPMGLPLNPMDSFANAVASGSGIVSGGISTSASNSATISAHAAATTLLSGTAPQYHGIHNSVPVVDRRLQWEGPLPVGGVPTTQGRAGSSASPATTAGSASGHLHPREEPRLHSLPDNTLNPLGLLAEASLQNQRKRPLPPPTMHEVLDSARGATRIDEDDHDHAGSEEDGDGGEGTNGTSEGGKRKRIKLGVANAKYFQPGPMNNLPLRRIMVEHRMPPELLVNKIVTVDEVVELFSIYFEKCHAGCPILDPEIHTPTATGARSPFLFTCICAVAARYYTKRTDDLYRKCLRVAKRVAFEVMTKGFKSTEICQGFLLLCQWNQPAERFEEERTYQFSGIAVRMATDLNLHRKSTAVISPDVSDEARALYEREMQNRERCWVYCFIADRSVANQMGKPYSIPKEDFIIRNAKTWFRQPGAQRTDVGLSAMAEMHRIVGRIVETLYSDTSSVSGLNPHLDYPTCMRSFLAQLDQWRTDWTITFDNDMDDPRSIMRFNLMKFYHSYYRLFLLSFAVQHALETPTSAIDLPRYCVLCFEASEIMITVTRDALGPQDYLRYGIDSTFVFLSYACCFLLKMCNPAFQDMIDAEKAIRLVSDGAEVLAKAAVDETHTPALYASFIRALIDNKRNGGRTAPGSRSGTRPSSPVVPSLDFYIKSRQGSAAPEMFSWGTEAGLPQGETDVPLADFNMFDTSAMDSMLSNGDFWNNMLMPGFGGPLQGLSGGTGTMLNPMDPWSVTPLHSRPASPNGMHNLHGFDFGHSEP